MSDYDDIVLPPPVPQLDLEEYGGPRHRRLVARLAAEIRRERLMQRVEAGIRRARVGRNDPCPCGSGRKFKKCCGQ